MPSINVALNPKGALFIVYLGLSAPKVMAMKAAGIPAPAPIAGTFLLDTGATSTVVDVALAQKLGLEATGKVAVQTPSTAGSDYFCNQYDASIWIPGDRHGMGFSIPAIPVLEAPLASQGIDGLIGIDIINRTTLIYNGSAGFVTLSY